MEYERFKNICKKLDDICISHEFINRVPTGNLRPTKNTTKQECYRVLVECKQFLKDLEREVECQLKELNTIKINQD